MKKNLRNILTIALGFVTVIATAQSWDADSRTRVNMSGDNDQFTTEQRTTLDANWGGNGWSINVNANHNMDLGQNNRDGVLNVVEANASTDLMGFASVTVGRQTLEYGSGAIIGANDWGRTPNALDGGLFNLDLDMMDVEVGYYRDNQGNEDEEDHTSMLINASKSDGDWSINLLYVSNEYNDGTDENAMGLDLGYAMMGGDLDLAVSYNSGTTTDGDDIDMMSIGATYVVSEGITLNAARTTYGENGFGSNIGNYGGDDSWNTHGNMGYLGADDEMNSYGVSYASGDFNLGVTMHNITNAENEEYERDVTEANFGYSLGDNSNVGIKYAEDGEDKYTWLTLSIGM
tara:strand:- start:53439 stop:54476 length:1038 start_codon:yes stop_codon:yes gene_type:complete